MPTRTCALSKLAGTGESGKSTVFKQMKILYSIPDTPAKYLMVVRANLFGNAHAVFQGAHLAACASFAWRELDLRTRNVDGAGARPAPVPGPTALSIISRC